MTTLLYMHPSSLEHDAGPGHPESPARMRAITTIFEREERKGALVGVERREPPRATPRAAGAGAHRPLRRRRTGCGPGVRTRPARPRHRDLARAPARRRCAPPARRSPRSMRVIGGEADNAFCALRPPGHHAEAERAMGFCLFNSVAIGARQALDVPRPRAGLDLRFRRAPRQRHPAQLRARAAGPVSLDPPVAALSRAPGRARRPGSATSSTGRCRPAPGRGNGAGWSRPTFFRRSTRSPRS